MVVYRDPTSVDVMTLLHEYHPARLSPLKGQAFADVKSSLVERGYS